MKASMRDSRARFLSSGLSKAVVNAEWSVNTLNPWPSSK